MREWEYGILNNGYFEKRVSDNIFWVPINTLGKRTYSSWEDYVMLSHKSPKEKKADIKTLFDAVLLFIASDFQEAEGVTHRIYNDIRWEFYQSGFEAVEKNAGCCSSCASWLGYLLAGKYEEIGSLSISRYRMDGHRINYIRHQGELYFIDMQTFIGQYLQYKTPETGSIKDFMKTRYITDLFVKAKGFEEYVNFHRRMMRNVVKDFIFMATPGDYCVPIGLKENDCRMRYLPGGYGVKVIDSPHPLNMSCRIVGNINQKRGDVQIV